jgi:hypothetical protein
MSDVIREFLVSLGFRIDANGMRRFQDAVSGSTSSVGGLGRAAFDAALQVTDAVEKMAKQYESLSYASQRTGASTGNLKSAAYAFSQIGLSAEEGAAAIERFADLMMNNPGKKSFVEGWGATAEDTATKLKQFMHNIKKAYPKKEDYFVASRMAETGGVGNDIFKQYFNNSEEFDKYFDAYNKKLEDAGLNTKKVADESKALGRALTELEADLANAKVSILQGLVEPATKAVTWVDNLVQSFNRLHGAATEASDKPSAHGGSWFSDMIAAALPEDQRKEYIKGYKELEEKWRDPESQAGQVTRGGKSGLGGYASTAPTANANSIRVPSGSAPPSGADRRRYVADFFMKQGWTKEQAWAIAGTLGGETSNFNPAEGGGWIRSKSGRLYKEDSYGVGQWHKERRDAFKSVFGKDIQGSSLEEQLAFVQWELKNTHKRAGEHLQRTNTPYAGVGVLVPEYEAPADTYGNIRSRGAEAEKWFRADLGRSRPSGWDTQTGPAASEGGASDASSNAVTQNNSFSMVVNGVTDSKGLNSAAEEAFRMMSHYMAVGASGLR